MLLSSPRSSYGRCCSPSFFDPVVFLLPPRFPLTLGYHARFGVGAASLQTPSLSLLNQSFFRLLFRSWFFLIGRECGLVESMLPHILWASVPSRECSPFSGESAMFRFFRRLSNEVTIRHSTGRVRNLFRSPLLHFSLDTVMIVVLHSGRPPLRATRWGCFSG